MVGGEEPDVGAGDVDGTGGGTTASDGCFRADFCGWRRGSEGALRAMRGSAGFSDGGMAAGADGPNSDIGGVGVGSRGGEGV